MGFFPTLGFCTEKEVLLAKRYTLLHKVREFNITLKGNIFYTLWTASLYIE